MPIEEAPAPSGSVEQVSLGATARAVADAARSLGIPVSRGLGVLRLGQGMFQRLFPVGEADPAPWEGLAPRVARDPAIGSTHVLVVDWRALAATRRLPGGAPADVTATVSPEVVRLAEHVADALGADVANVEVTDDGRVGTVVRGARLDWHPAQARVAALAIVRMLFPPGAPSRVPLVVVCECEAVGAGLGLLLGAAGHPVGTARDATVLGHPHVARAVITRSAEPRPAARLGFDRADVVVIGARADLGDVLPVVRRLSREGALLVHADHPALCRIAAATDARLVVHHADVRHPIVGAHAVSGGMIAYLSADDAVVVRRGHNAVRVLEGASAAGLPGTPDDVVASAVAAWFVRSVAPRG